MKKVYVKKAIVNGESIRILRDSETLEMLYAGTPRTVQDYKDECLHGENECAILLERFESVKTGKLVYVWVDCETQELFISY